MRDDLARLCISPKTTIEEAARRIAEGGEKVALVVDEEGRLLGIFVDGDLRRALLKHISLSSPVEQVMCASPRVCFSDETAVLEKAKEIMLNHKIEHVPVVDRDGKLVDLLRWRDFFAKPKLDFRHLVVIMAGGKGSRLDPFTKILPKPLIPLGDKPIIHHIMDRFTDFGFCHFILSLNYKADMVKMYFRDNFPQFRIDYICEDKPLGTAGSLSLMRDFLSDTFFVTNCDILVDDNYNRMLEFHKDNKNALTVVVSQKTVEIPYGVMEVSEKGELIEVREKPCYDFLVNTGFYLLEPYIVDLIPEGRYYTMIDLIEDLQRKSFKVGVFPIKEGSWFDVGQWAEYRKTLRHFSEIWSGQDW